MMLICDDRGNASAGGVAGGTLSTARAIRIDPTGRARVEQLQSEVEAVRAALAAAGVAVVCP
jgi:hypothetical protein